MSGIINPSLLRSGDIVHVRGRVNNRGNIQFCTSQPSLPIARAVVVSVEPRPLTLGDKVVEIATGEAGRVIGIDGDEMWVRFTEDRRILARQGEFRRALA